MFKRLQGVHQDAMRDLTGLRNIVLIGFMGTGKTSVGKRLALRLGWAFFDSDEEIEDVMGMTVADIFSRYGEIRFRSEEKLSLRKLARLNQIVLATGGGAVLDQENLDTLRQTGVLITLEASPEVILQRTFHRGTRPLLKKDNSAELIQKFLAQREFAYRQGDIRVDTSEITVDEVVDVILERLEEHGYGKGQG